MDYVDFNRYNINDDTEDYIRRYISPIEGESGILDNEMIYNYIIRHPRYNHNTTDFDYALIVLNETEAIDSIPNLALNFDTDIPYIEQELQVVGWGALEENGFGPDVPHQVTKSYITNEQCTSDPFEYEEGLITENMLCAADIDGDDNAEDSCQGDSGGPLMTVSMNDEEEPVLVGIVSWGRGCARFPYPGVYARIQPPRSPSQTIRRTTEEEDGLGWIVSTILERIGDDINPTATTSSTSSSTESPQTTVSSGTTVISTTIASGGTSTTSTVSPPSTTTTAVSSKSNKSPKVVEGDDGEEGDNENDNSRSSKSAKAAKRDNNRRCNTEEGCIRKRIREHAKYDDVSFILHTTDEEEE